jgi:hypothetical protein
MEIRTSTRRLAEKVYPGLTPRQLSTKINDDMQRYYVDKLTEPDRDALVAAIEESERLRLTPREVNQLEQSLDSVPADGSTRAITERIALQSPAIDDQNWVAIRLGVEQAKNRALWCDPASEKRLIEQLNVDFEDARNPFRVQKSRITAFFARLIDE